MRSARAQETKSLSSLPSDKVSIKFVDEGHHLVLHMFSLVLGAQL